MLLSDRGLRRALNDGVLRLSYPPGCPPAEPRVQPASIDVHLDRFFCQPLTNDWTADFAISPRTSEANGMSPVEAVSDCFALEPHGFALGATLEHLQVGPEIAVKIEGCSSLGRLGLQIHATAGWIDPGFRGHVTLELVNARNRTIWLYPGMKIAQLAVMRLDAPAELPYGSRALHSHYQGQGRGPQVSRSHDNFYTLPLKDPS